MHDQAASRRIMHYPSSQHITSHSVTRQTTVPQNWQAAFFPPRKPFNPLPAYQNAADCVDTNKNVIDLCRVFTDYCLDPCAILFSVRLLWQAGERKEPCSATQLITAEKKKNQKEPIVINIQDAFILALDFRREQGMGRCWQWCACISILDNAQSMDESYWLIVYSDTYRTVHTTEMFALRNACVPSCCPDEGHI
jgi:hypothetical protein